MSSTDVAGEIVHEIVAGSVYTGVLCRLLLLLVRLCVSDHPYLSSSFPLFAKNLLITIQNSLEQNRSFLLDFFFFLFSGL